MTAHERLTRVLVALVDRGTPPPCAGRREWLSDDFEERDAAAWRCAPCPIIAECAAAADELGARFGVWGGVDRARRRRAA